MLPGCRVSLSQMLPGCRVRDTVLVCKRWSTLCLDHPPRNPQLAIQLKKDYHPTYLHWIAKQGGSGSGECVDLTLGVALPRSLVSQTISCLASPTRACIGFWSGNDAVDDLNPKLFVRVREQLM